MFLIIKEKAKKVIRFLANPRLMLCFLIAWFITNGWAYVVFSLGTWLKIRWMIAVGGAYLAFLWLPSPEKILTVAIALFLLRILFPKDERTLGELRKMYKNLKEKIFKRKKKQDL